jgi:hypothetical protein
MLVPDHGLPQNFIKLQQNKYSVHEDCHGKLDSLSPVRFIPSERGQKYTASCQPSPVWEPRFGQRWNEDRDNLQFSSVCRFAYTPEFEYEQSGNAIFEGKFCLLCSSFVFNIWCFKGRPAILGADDGVAALLRWTVPEIYMRFHRNEVHADEEVNDPYLQGNLSALFQVRLEGFKGSILALWRCFNLYRNIYS